MNICVLLAGGKGTRMRNHSIPKQFIEICNRPIIIRTLENLINTDLIDTFYVAILPQYISKLQTLLDKYIPDQSRIKLVCGGKERIDSIQNSFKEIVNLNFSDENIVIFHDAVRPFVTKRVIKDSIECASKYGACVAVIPATDTMYFVDTDGIVRGYPDRSTLFHGQAPDTFKVGVFKKCLGQINDLNKKNITGTIQICNATGYPVKTIMGDVNNFKITTEDDLKKAEAIIMFSKEYK